MAFSVALEAEGADTVVSDAVGQYLTDCHARNLSSQTRGWYGDRLRRLLPAVGDRPLFSVILADARQCLADLQGDRAHSTVNGYVRSLKTFLNWADRDAVDRRAEGVAPEGAAAGPAHANRGADHGHPRGAQQAHLPRATRLHYRGPHAGHRHSPR